ncbi:hypothetical protein TraAM80_05107 [Trypanosoma rangeli]|uniref:Uncharacterized protein n=1 Tax=Trypanosoma rangeli TaxID=5698 RepID=A0A422NGB0_TRYRA|nr:uncharacterized protein TraAM80_05107 [Trypanosoma rangeli]RNF04515.1 hypothetical protein TraAM80_05107 [Trypanosoma rangeli]|eukprot:RNF04515.1 hypothetical protein TraAM80_05107 [Trypanosoma rangeli]
MARRQRVPHHKEHRRRRNKNPKLSPFQREQKRKKLANQVPISSMKNDSLRDYPVSQRTVMKYLMAKKNRLQERRRQREEGLQKKQRDTEEQISTTATNSEQRCEFNGCASSPTVTFSSVTQTTLPSNVSPPATEVVAKKRKENCVKKAKKTSLITPVALNEEIAASLTRPIIAFKTLDAEERERQEDSVEAIIARKKEKKHRKKAEARRERVREALRKTEEQLKEEVFSVKGGKKRNRADRVDAKNAAFERKLKQMQREKEKTESAAAAEKKTAGKSEKDTKKRSRKQITFSDGVENTGTDAPHRAMRYPGDKGSKVPRDFCELVDVVRYGERVEAPPVFDALPRHDASISRLAKRLEFSSRESSKKGIASSQHERLQLLSSVSGVGEGRRLERLGLGPVATSAAPTRPVGAFKKLSKEEEMQRLREAVMDAYRRNKRTGAEARKNVDMHHQFPVFS